ncbi:VENN motif pre-toxin domain-containing protein [Candidatus Symbiopectobacterium sp. NZEC151]|uniref:VENN motif pre-toxin domain-containing protein n=1 Tax=Candidatus Symbiopectobacterium sp. NZEC151 TaxID=2820470 RepID=UPI0029CAB971|nr:VENN motif pre-toxin domain-containing protein [Candidatus Symbiopectobacterium sp. NZEC151]
MSPSMQGNMLSSLAMTMPSALMSLGSNGSASSTTYAAVSEGSLLIRDTANQQQDVTTLSHDVEHANNALSPIFNKEKEQQRLRQAQLIGEIGGQVMDIVRTEGEQRALKKAEESGEVGYPRPADDANDKDIDKKWAAYKAALTQTQSYKDEMKQYGVGSSYQQAAQAATAAIQALAGGDIRQAIAGGAAPYLAQLVKEATLPAKGEPTTEQRAANLMGHAIVGAVVAQLSGKDAGSGALGAASGELAAEVIRQKMFDGRDVKDVSESEKQSLSALSTLAAGLASGLASGNTADGASGAQAGRNAVENNYLNSKNVLDMLKELEEADKKGTDKLAIYEKYAEISKENRESAVAEDCSGNPLCANGTLSEAAAGSDIANSLKRLPIFSGLSSDDLAQLDRFVLAENEDSARAIYQAMPDYVKVALNGKEAVKALGLGSAVGGKSLAALGVIGKGGKGSSLPVAEKTTASNGIDYKSNPKHTPGQMGYNRDAGTKPANSIELFGNSIGSGKKRYSLDSEGNVHQFTNTNDGSWHWSGSTGDKSVAIPKSDIPSDIKKQLGLPGKWRQS